MKPVMQCHKTGCFDACLASILELPLDAVPVAQGDDWIDDYNRWLAPRGLALVVVGPPLAVLPNGYVIGVAPAGGERDHAVILYDGRIVHDPAPRPVSLGPWSWWMVFAALDPTREVAP